MIYKPAKGKIWDSSVIWNDGVYFMFSMYIKEGDLDSYGMWLAVSEDGVHWKDYGCVLESSTPIWKMFIFKHGDKFYMNHGTLSNREVYDNDTLRYFESNDLIHWRHIDDNHPDPRWYNEKGRWDHMYVIPKNAGNPEDGYWGYVVATPAGESTGAWGLQQSSDGIQWQAVEPPEIEWGNVPQSREFEGGGCEKIGDTYYYIGGCCPPYAGNYGYSIYTFISDNPTGPFKPDVDAFRLCGFSGIPGKMFVQGLAAWCKVENEQLISCYMVSSAGGDNIENTWFLPIRKAILDKDGHLRLGYWMRNELLKGNRINIDFSKCILLSMNNKSGTAAVDDTQVQGWDTPVFCGHSDSLEIKTESLSKGYQLEDRHMIVLLDEILNFRKGIVLEGNIKAAENPQKGEVRARCWRPALAGVYIEQKQPEGLAILMEVGHPLYRHTYIRTVRCKDNIEFDDVDITGPGCATVSGLDSGKNHSFRLLLRINMFELYIDDLLVQTFIVPDAPTGRLGFMIQNAKCDLEDLKMWEMSLLDFYL